MKWIFVESVLIGKEYEVEAKSEEEAIKNHQLGINCKFIRENVIDEQLAEIRKG